MKIYIYLNKEMSGQFWYQNPSDKLESDSLLCICEAEATKDNPTPTCEPLCLPEIGQVGMLAHGKLNVKITAINQ